MTPRNKIPLILFIFAVAFSFPVQAAKVESGYIRKAPERGQRNSGYVHAAPSQEDDSQFKKFQDYVTKLFTGK